MKKVINIFLLLIFALGASAQQAVIDKVVGTVGGELVLLSEVEEQLSLMEAQNGKMPEGTRCNIVDGIMTSKLLLNQAKLDSVEVADEEVESQLNARIDRILSYMNNDVSQFEAYYGQSVSAIRDQFREDLRNQILTDRMRGQIMRDVKVTPSEVKDFFYNIPKDSLPYFNSEVEIGEIVYKPKVNAGERQKALDKLTALRVRVVEGGEDFGAIASKFSDDFGSARLSGDLGWTKRGQFVPEFEAVAYNMEQGEISEIVETEFGFHVIQTLERRGNSIHVRHILVKPQITDADLELAKAHLDSVRMLIETDSITFSRAVKEYSDENTQSYNNDGRMVNPTTGNTFFETGDLDPDIYFTIDTMDVGKISQPFKFADPRGEALFRIVKLQSRTAPHKASLELDYSKIQQAAIEAKKNEFITTWVIDKIRNTYVSIDTQYSGCKILDKWSNVTIRP